MFPQTLPLRILLTLLLLTARTATASATTVSVTEVREAVAAAAAGTSLVWEEGGRLVQDWATGGWDLPTPFHLACTVPCRIDAASSPSNRRRVINIHNDKAGTTSFTNVTVTGGYTVRNKKKPRHS